MILPDRRFIRAGILVLVLGLSGAAWALEPAHSPTTIRIHLTGNGIVVTPERVTIRQGEELEWTSDHQFAVAVQRSAELFGQELPAAALRGMKNASVRRRAGTEAPAGTYKYSVAVWDGENVWVVDPEIIIQPN